jgi:arsenite methyltransferase
VGSAKNDALFALIHMHTCTINQLNRRKKMSKTAEEVRSTVSNRYSEAVASPPTTKGGCYGSEPGPARKGSFVDLAGYSGEEVASLPASAVADSFGCGNPVAFSALKPGDVVLDLGSGAGIDLLLAAKKVGPGGRVIGVDMTDEMIARANENIRTENLTNVEVRKGIIEDLPVESASVDWVISNCVINLSPEKPKVFREIARVLKPGGQMLVSDIVANDLPEEILANAALYASCVAGAISEEKYLDGLRSVGLTDVAVRGRLVYDANQLESAFSDSKALSLLPPQDIARLRERTRSVAGKVWSAKIYARKPD